jgi:hypothetical protein
MQTASAPARHTLSAAARHAPCALCAGSAGVWLAGLAGLAECVCMSVSSWCRLLLQSRCFKVKKPKTKKIQKNPNFQRYIYVPVFLSPKPELLPGTDPRDLIMFVPVYASLCPNTEYIARQARQKANPLPTL